MLKEIYESFNLKRCRLTKFEEYDFYADKKDFLNSTDKSILTFIDLDGSLMAMRPDVTLSVIRKRVPGRWFYHNIKVYRPDTYHQHFRELPQSGIELLGELTDSDTQLALDIATKCLDYLANGRKYVLDTNDPSAVNKHYYSGLTFKGYIEGIPSCVLSGGQYDGILRAMNSPLRNGIGFAIYLDRLGDDFDD